MLAAAPALRFDRFELQPQERRLLVGGHDAGLGGRALDVLIVLAQRAGQLVSRNDLIDLAWPGLVVEENNLSVQISSLRKVLGGEIIATVPGRGYRFTAPVDDAPALIEPQPAAPAPAVKLQTNLPAVLRPLLGREGELAALGTLLDQHRLVTLVGSGGIGKTLLAQHLLAQRQQRYTHSVCWAELASIADAAALPSAIAAALGVQLGSGAGLDALSQALAPLDMLLVLDNAEHLLADVAGIADALHRAAPQLRLLVTSQAPLKVAAERVLRLDALSVPEAPLSAAQAIEFGAVALFVERARAADSRFALTDANVAATIALCRALDGLPLAIELAAARAPVLGVHKLAASMHERLHLLARGADRHAPLRQQTLRAALEWSHALLAEAERIVFRRLAVMAGSADLELVMQVVVDPAGQALDEWSALDALSTLVERSLVVVIPGPAGTTRYRLLDSPRALAREKLAEAGEADVMHERHARAVAQRLAAADDDHAAGRIGIIEWSDRSLPDIDNGLQALAWADAHADHELALCIVPALMNLTRDWASQAELSALAGRCEALAAVVQPAARAARALADASHTHDQKPRRGVLLIERALAMAQELALRDAATLYLLWCEACQMFARAHHLEQATAALAAACALEQPDWPPGLRQRRWNGAFQLGHLRGDGQAVLHAQQQCVLLTRTAGGSTASALANLIDAQLFAGRAEDAVQSGRALIAELEGTRFETPLALARLNLAAALLALDNTAEARAIAQAGWPQAARFQMQPYWADYFALLAVLEGRAADAARLAGFADAAYVRNEDERQSNEIAAIERARTLTRAALGEAEAERLQAEGARCSDGEAAALAFGEAR